MHVIFASGIANTGGIELLLFGMPLVLLSFLLLVGLLSISRHAAHSLHAWWQHRHITSATNSTDP